MHVLIFLPSLEGGGAERVAATLANAWTEANKITLVLASKTGPYLDDLSPHVEVVGLGTERISRSVLKLANVIRKRKPDVLFSTLAHANIAAAMARLLSGPHRPGLFVREAIAASSLSGASSGIGQRLIDLLRGPAYKSADGVICLSLGVEFDLVTNFGISEKKTHVIYNPLDLGLIAERSRAPKPELYREIAGPIILSAGRLSYQKDYSTLLRAFARVLDERQATLVILGEGEDRQDLEAEVERRGLGGRVIMPGFVDNPFVYMRHAQVFALTSRFEGLPNAMLQAVAVGMPIVSTDCPSGPFEILHKGTYGWLAPVGDDKLVAEGLLAGLAGQLTTVPESVVAETYEANRVAERYLSVFRGAS